MTIKLTEKQKIKVQTPADVYPIMQQVLLREGKLQRGQEYFWVIGLNNRGRILFVELISLGSNNRANVNPPEVFRMAIYKLATTMILVHNHPSGELTPSVSDKDLTDHLLKVGKFINIEVLDHLVISETDYYSFAEAGIMTELRAKPSYRILDKEEEQLINFVAEREKELAEIKRATEIAKRMKKEGYSDEMIKKLTKLGLREIKKL